jgi:diadenosine tetraphosphate (Ap4A) HIT family hydrolase
MVPHLHWHVIPRFRNDRHFPNPIWGQAQRVATPNSLPNLKDRLADILQQTCTQQVR